MSYERTHDLPWDKMEEECGLIGIYGPGKDVARLAYFGLFALQHRGQESAGIAVGNERAILFHKGMGLVTEAFDERKLKELQGDVAIGHVRYSTTGSSLLANAQPLIFRYSKGMMAVAHNGNLTNAAELRHNLAVTGAVFQTTTDTEVVVNLLARYGQSSLEEALIKTMIDIKGSYSLLVMTEKRLLAVRDPHGVRPLCLGRLGDAYVIASESCALDTLGADFVRDIEPGEIISIDENGLVSLKALTQPRRAACIFEYIYFARPDSVIDGISVNQARRAMGRQLALECKIDADIVIGVPDSGTAAAIGYAQESGIPFDQGLMKNRYVGRTFIQPTQEIRAQSVRLKLNAVAKAVEGKRVIMIDDSIVRGTTSGKIVQMLRHAGAKEVHMLVSSPPITHPCYYGIDTSVRKELVAATKTIEEICEMIGAESLHYLSREGLLRAMTEQNPHIADDNYCMACFCGSYPIEIPIGLDKYAMEGCGC
ncbi:amidophosphoribosyltransferase [Heliomicrobium modesticaldum Ice1]|uniref:Amidophosphoribosyltransferase n=1 Tax=Heliobacterium modesticaldum (strain ATCC 51547 / Ice1) TaxID=498761 RepID=B0TEC8_HELMI|nr:amidophosphoribosyltransferase [Heliomicrobium modesticaldum]ABZ85610.1 amidophosphoribosyltransferase [Heliomicrobium modesticaldum Ice1]